MKSQLINQIILYALFGLFLYSSVIKIMDLGSFELKMLRSGHLSASYIPIIKWGVPLIELAIPALLWFERTRPYAWYLSLFILISFTIYLVFLDYYFPGTPCSCGGLFEKLTFTQHLLLNLMLILMNLVPIYSKYRNKNNLAHA